MKKYTKRALLVFWSFAAIIAMAQDPLKNVVITSEGNKTEVRTNERCELLVNVSKKDARKFKARGVVYYGDFGARGDGKTDDIDAITAAHVSLYQDPGSRTQERSCCQRKILEGTRYQTGIVPE